MTAEVRWWTMEPPPPDVERSIERLAACDDVVQVAVMPDVHLAGEVCVGVAAATGSLLYPEAVGGDIGCGMAAIAFESGVEILDERGAARLLAGLAAAVPILRQPGGRHSEIAADPAVRDWSHPRLATLARRDGALEFGTLGRGNHFLELQEDSEGRMWLMLHSGSRALGPAIRDHHLVAAERSPAGLRFLAASSDAGRAYLGDMESALAWADASRRAMVEATVDLMGRLFGIRADASSYRACHHNHVRREEHGARALWVHRKGAIPAAEGEPGIIPGSMGAPSHHTEGRGLSASLGSSSHGAGRALPRGEARRRISVRELERQLAGVWFDHRRADLLRDEAPAAYKEIRRVMRVQHELTRVVRTLEPRLVYKGG